MPSVHRKWLWPAVVALLLLQAVQALTLVHRESLTFDEDDHMFAGYMMWKTADYGLNPEHPPLVKLLAAVPVLKEKLWVPPLQGRDFKKEAYLDGRDWLARNDGGSQRLVFRMRASTEILALGLCLIVFLAARECFGDTAALIALVLLVFDPNFLAHSALVTTDIGVSLFFVATVYAFYRYATKYSMGRLVFAGLALGLLLATKHSGILVAPMLLLLAFWETFSVPREERKREILRYAGALAAMAVIGVAVLWAFYGFRYAARPAGLQLSTSLAEYAAPLSHYQSSGVMAAARLHLLPESYLMGLVDVKRMAEFYPAFLFGKVYPHGRWYYFPAVILIKTTLGLLALLVVAGVTIFTGKFGRRELVYVLIPPVLYLAVAMLSGLNIGARHLLPMYAFAIIFAGAGAATLAQRSRGWAVACGVLVAAQVISALMVFPNNMAYANEAWGGAKNTHNLLSDANVDWAQQLLHVKQWQDRNPHEECWFAYFARPEILPETYGIHCHALPTIDTMWLGGEEIVPPQIHGTVLVSAGDLSGCEWPTGAVNPYRNFIPLHPDETIDDAVYVYRGDFHIDDAAAIARAQRSGELLTQGQAQPALAMAKDAVAIQPRNVYAQTALGDAAAAAGYKQQARAAWQTAIEIAQQFEPDAQLSYVPELQKKLAGLNP